MLKKLALVAIASSFAMSAFAGTGLQSSVELKDGSTLHIFQDGKMGMEDKVGRSFLMKEGHAMETQDGRTVQMQGNEVWRVEALGALYRGS